MIKKKWGIVCLTFLSIFTQAQKKTIIPPSDLTVITIKANQIKIGWNDNAENEDGFYVYRKYSDSKSSLTRIGKLEKNTTIFIDSTVSPSSSYYYSVSTFSEGTETELLEPYLLVKTLDGRKNQSTNLLPPSFFYLHNIKSNRISITWEKDSTIKNETIRIYRSTDPISLFLKKSLVGEAPSEVFSFIDTNLVSNTTYYYSLSSLKNTEESEISKNIIFAKTLNKKTNSVPINPSRIFTSNIKTDQVNLNWIDNTVDENGFIIFRSETNLLKDTIRVGIVGSNNTVFVDKNLKPDTHYYYYIVAYNSNGFKLDNITSIATKTLKNNSTQLVTIPNGPKKLSFSNITTSSITLNWVDDSFNEDGFYIYRAYTSNFSDLKLVSTVTANVSTFTDLGLEPNTQYFYTISATNIAGTSFLNNGGIESIYTQSIASPPASQPNPPPPPPPPSPPSPPPSAVCEDFTNHGISQIHLFANKRENLLVGTFYANSQPQYYAYGEWKDALYLGNEIGSGRKLWGYREGFKGSTTIQVRTKGTNNDCTIFSDVRNTYPYDYLGDDRRSIPSLPPINHRNLSLLFFVSTDIENNQGNYNIYLFAIKEHIPNLSFRINGGSWQNNVEYKTQTSIFSNTAVNITVLPFLHVPKDFIIDFSTDNGQTIDRYIVRRNTTGGHFGVSTTFTRVENNEVIFCLYQGDMFVRSFLMNNAGEKIYSDAFFGNSFRLGHLPQGDYIYKFGFQDSDLIFDNNVLIQVN